MIVQHNMASANTNRQLGITNGLLAKSTEKLSSGYRINRAADDAAGLSISEKMRGQIRGLEQASTNAQDGISMIQTAEGAMNEVHSILQRMRELTVQASNDTNVAEDRMSIYLEVSQLMQEIDRIADETEFNTMKLLKSEDRDLKDGEMTIADKEASFQVGANSEQAIKFKIGNMNTETMTFWGTDDAEEVALKEILDPFKEVAAGDLDIEENYATLTVLLDTIDAAIEVTSKNRSYLGAMQNRLEHTVANADNTAENLQAAESRIRDVDMADEMVGYSKDSILQQAGQSMLAQANQATQGVLSLLR